MKISESFWNIGEYYAAGLFEEEDRNLFYRNALAIRRYLENCPLQEYHGEKLYPSGTFRLTLAVNPLPWSDGFAVDDKLLAAKNPELVEKIKEVIKYKSFVKEPHGIFSEMSNHSIPYYERILEEGLDSYEERIRKMKNVDMREGLLHVVAGIRSYHSRSIAYLRSVNADPVLTDALEVVPFGKCQNVIQAIVGWNFIMYLECGADMHPGCLSQGLTNYYKGEDTGLLEEYIRNLYLNVDANDGWSVSLGLEDNPLITTCLRAAKGIRKPLIELFTDKNTSDEVWEVALDNILSGCGQPAFFNKELYMKGYRERFQVPEEDLHRLCGGGCAEILVPGKSNVGTVDASVHLLYILEKTIYEILPGAKSFSEFYEIYIERLHQDALAVMKEIAMTQEYRAKNCARPFRTLLTDDCIERELDYCNNGTVFGWSMVGFGGIVNTIDALMVIKDKVFDNKKYTPEELIQKLQANDLEFLQECKSSPHRHGIDDEETNALAHNLTERIFAFTKEGTTYIGRGFVPCTVMWKTYEHGGAIVGATPCGRKSGEAVADSLTAIFGKDTEGPTAMLKSVASIDLPSVIGSPIVNLTVQPGIDRDILKSLIMTFLELGGMQLQISCVDKETIQKAYEHPEDYKNLIVRVGGFCEYYYNLSDTLKRKVLERTFHISD